MAVGWYEDWYQGWDSLAVLYRANQASRVKMSGECQEREQAEMAVYKNDFIAGPCSCGTAK